MTMVRRTPRPGRRASAPGAGRGGPRRGANASTSTPASAAPNTTSIGASWLYSMLGPIVDGAAIVASAESAATARRSRLAPFRLQRAECAGAGSVGVDLRQGLACTAGLITSSTGFG